MVCFDRQKEPFYININFKRGHIISNLENYSIVWMVL